MRMGSVRQLKDWLRNKEKQEGIPANTFINFYIMERLLERIAISVVTVPTPAVLFSMLVRSLKGGGKRAAFAATGLKKPVEKARDLAFLAELAESGHIRPVIDWTCPLEQMAEAQRVVRAGHKKGNVLITI